MCYSPLGRGFFAGNLKLDDLSDNDFRKVSNQSFFFLSLNNRLTNNQV